MLIDSGDWKRYVLDDLVTLSLVFKGDIEGQLYYSCVDDNGVDTQTALLICRNVGRSLNEIADIIYTDEPDRIDKARRLVDSLVQRDLMQHLTGKAAEYEWDRHRDLGIALPEITDDANN